MTPCAWCGRPLAPTEETLAQAEADALDHFGELQVKDRVMICRPCYLKRYPQFKETGDFAGIGGRPESDEHVSLHTPPP